MKYIVSYNNIEIGVLEINKKNQYKYTPNEKLTTEVKEKISLFPELLVQSEWGKPIPIFENRIRDAKSFSQEKDISTQTDLFQLVLVDNIS